MTTRLAKGLVAAAVAAVGQTAVAGTDIYFNPLTQSSAVATPNHVNELNSPWQTPPGLSQVNLTSLREAEADVAQSLLRVPGADTSATMLDMSAFSPDGKWLFLPHETPWGAGASRYDVVNDRVETIFQGDGGGLTGDWADDYGAFDPAFYTPNGTLFLGEEWTAEGRIIEILNPKAPVAQIQWRELQSIANVAHEGLQFSADERTLYFVDEWNSGSLYKFVMAKKGDYTKGQTFVLVVDAFGGDPAANYNQGVNAAATRTGLATWVPITDKNGTPLTQTDPFRNGPTSDPRNDPGARGGRAAADEVRGTPYGRPEDMEIGRLANGREVLYVAVTSEQSIYSIELLSPTKAIVRVAASETGTPKNLGFPATTGRLNSPDNLAQDALGNIYVIEDAPNGDSVGGDIWFMRDTDSDGVAESLDHFMSVQVDGAEATGMIFNPVKPTQFVVSVQHPDSVTIPNGFGDAVWQFDLEDIAPPVCDRNGWRYTQTCTHASDYHFVDMLQRANRRDRKHWEWDWR
jgi:hypothetical protein